MILLNETKNQAEEEIAEAETEVKARARAEAVQEIEEESNLFQRVHLALLALEADLQREATQVHDHLLVQTPQGEVEKATVDPTVRNLPALRTKMQLLLMLRQLLKIHKSLDQHKPHEISSNIWIN